MNACRVVYVVDEPGRFGLAYGTLPGHVERGEERFLVERDSTDGSVWYDLLAFSRPNSLVARLAPQPKQDECDCLPDDWQSVCLIGQRHFGQR